MSGDRLAQMGLLARNYLGLDDPDGAYYSADEITDRAADDLVLARDVLALVEIAKAARDDSLADLFPIIEHALTGGSPPDALRHIRTVIVKHRQPILSALARLDSEATEGDA